MKITDDMLTEWRKQFEVEFPMPPDCVWTGKGYVATSYNAWETHTFIARWEGWQAARRTTPDREAWISVDERLPETAHFVLAVNKMAAVKCVQYYHGEWIGMGGVTHWMPLPAAPSSEDGGA